MRLYSITKKKCIPKLAKKYSYIVFLHASHSIVHDPLAKALRHDVHWQMADLEPIRAFLRSERDSGAFSPVFDGGLWSRIELVPSNLWRTDGVQKRHQSPFHTLNHTSSWTIRKPWFKHWLVTFGIQYIVHESWDGSPVLFQWFWFIQCGFMCARGQINFIRFILGKAEFKWK